MFFSVEGRSYDLGPWDADAVKKAIAVLRGAGIDDPVGEARRIWAASFAPDYVNFGEFADKAPYNAFMRRVQQRAQRAPLSHILGKRFFYDHQFKVTADVLDPRPETELLVATALETPWNNVLDLGTGSGAIVISLLAARPKASGVGTDLSAAALNVAAQNAAQVGVEARLQLRPGSWFEALEAGPSFDLIVSNPPYIAAHEMADLSPEVLHEPRMALTDEGDGLSCYRILTAGAAQHLKPGGWLMVEIGPTQGQAVSTMFAKAGFTGIEIRPDLDGRDRVVIGQNPQKSA